MCKSVQISSCFGSSYAKVVILIDFNMTILLKTLRFNAAIRHNNIKPYECPHPDCKRSFVIRFELKRHMRVHTGRKNRLLLIRDSY